MGSGNFSSLTNFDLVNQETNPSSEGLCKGVKILHGWMKGVVRMNVGEMVEGQVVGG